MHLTATNAKAEASRSGTARSIRQSARLLIAGQLSYSLVTLLHTSGHANDHDAIFAAYAGSGIWTAVHIAQFAAMGVFIAGLLGLFSALRDKVADSDWAVRFGTASTTAALALYGALQAVDGVALKHGVDTWVAAPAAEKAARFATAEGIRWLEWGVRSYHDFALGIALVLAAVVLVRSAWIARPIGYLAGLTGVLYLLQGWMLGATGFSHGHDMLITAAWSLGYVWMPWLGRVARRADASE